MVDATSRLAVSPVRLVAFGGRAEGLLGGVVEPVALKAAHAKGRAGHPVLSLLSRRSRT